MKKITYFLFALVLFISTASTAQQEIYALDDTIEFSETIIDGAESGEIALRSLIIDYLVNNNTSPNVTGYMSSIIDEMDFVEEFTEEVYYSIADAEAANSNIDATSIQSLTVQMEVAEDAVLNNSTLLKNAIEQNQINDVYLYNAIIKNNLNTLISLANTVITEAETFISTYQFYNVRIELVDYQSGNAVDPGVLPSYHALNQETGEYTYPESYYDPINLLELRLGTYMFGARDGYFDGASSKIVTLDSSMVGDDGYIVITLSYWSE